MSCTALRRLTQALVAGVCILAVPVQAEAGPADGPNQDMHKMNIAGGVYFTWQNREFDTLEAMATAYRSNRMRDVSGSFWLPQFYAGFTQMVATDSEALLSRWEPVRAEWVAKFPNSPTPHIAHAHILVHLAWKARGEKYANEVFDDQWKAFGQRLEEARRYLLAHEAVARNDPRFYELMGKIEFFLNGNHAALIDRIDEGQRHFPAYLEYYSAVGPFLLPKWGGSLPLYYSFLDKAEKAGRESDGTGQFARVYANSYGGPLHYAEIAHQGPLWPRMKASIEDELAHFPHWFVAKKFIVVACKSYDDEFVMKLKQRMVQLSADSPTSTNEITRMSAAEYCQRVR